MFMLELTQERNLSAVRYVESVSDKKHILPNIIKLMQPNKIHLNLLPQHLNLLLHRLRLLKLTKEHLLHVSKRVVIRWWYKRIWLLMASIWINNHIIFFQINCHHLHPTPGHQAQVKERHPNFRFLKQQEKFLWLMLVLVQVMPHRQLLWQHLHSTSRRKMSFKV